MDRRKFILTDSHAIAHRTSGAHLHVQALDLHLLERLAFGELPELDLCARLKLADTLLLALLPTSPLPSSFHAMKLDNRSTVNRSSVWFSRRSRSRSLKSAKGSCGQDGQAFIGHVAVLHDLPDLEVRIRE